MENFFCGRWRYTRVGDYLSEPSSIISGVIQGSCISPLLFLLYLNNLTTIFDNKITCVLFADDVKLYTVIKCHGPPRTLTWSRVTHLFLFETLECLLITSFFAQSESLGDVRSPLHLTGSYTHLSPTQQPIDNSARISSSTTSSSTLPPSPSPSGSTQPCILLGSLNRVPALLGWSKGGNVTSAVWQVTLWDPIWHVSSRSGALLVAQTAIRFLTLPYHQQQQQH